MAGQYPSSTNAATELSSLVGPFGIPSSSVDGADVAAVHGAVSDAIRRARLGEGPTFIEARTVRWPGSRPIWPELLTGETDLAMAWDEIRIPQEYRQWHARQDGLLAFTRQLISAGVVTPEGVLAVDGQVKGDMEAAVRFALDSPEPELAAAFEGVFA